MIVDSSAVIAVLRDEPDRERVVSELARSDSSRMSAANWLEAAIVVDSNGDPVLSGRFDDLVAEAQIRIEPVSPAQAEIARHAYRSFGRGSGHRAQLNFGDCFAYALSRSSGEPLLFVGDDFGHTDVTTA